MSFRCILRNLTTDNFPVKYWKTKHIIIATFTFNKDIVGTVLWNQSVWLYGVTLLVSVLLVDLWSADGAPLAHLFLHTLQTLVQLVPLQQAGQLVLGKVSWTLRGSEEESVLKRRIWASACECEWVRTVPLVVCGTWSGVFWKTLSCLWEFRVSFQEAGWWTPPSWCPLSWGLRTILPETQGAIWLQTWVIKQGIYTEKGWAIEPTNIRT